MMHLNVFKWLVFPLFFHVFTITVAHASHIAGGEISYKFVRQDNQVTVYAFTLKSYTYEFNVGGTINTAPVNITNTIYTAVCRDGVCGSFSAANKSVVSTSRYVNIPTLSACIKKPNARRLIETVIVWNESLADIDGSYIIKSESCCRNGTISNLLLPNVISAIYAVEITPESQRLNNNSPIFSSFPPSFFCANEPIAYDHSAIDEEGDQVVYSICQASGQQLSVANYTLPMPFTSVNYRLPTYSSVAPMGGNPILAINRNTGKMTGTPNIIGEFVVSICAEEYRGGVLLSRMSRDFQFNVLSCERLVVATLRADTVNGKRFSVVSKCDSTTVTFENKSYNRDSIRGYYWTFNINDSVYKFTDWRPTVTFPNAGRYSGKLVVSPNTDCKDSAFVEVTIKGKPKANFTIKYDTCSATPVQFTNTSSQTPPLSAWRWNFGNGALDSNKIDTEHQFSTAGQQRVSLIILSNEGCRDTMAKSFDWRPAPAILIVQPDAFTGCAPAKVSFKNRTIPFDSTYNIRWEFGDGTNSNLFSPTHIYPKSDTFSVKVSVTSPIGCYKEEVFRSWIKVKQPPKADFDWSPKDISNLKPTVNFTDKSTTSIINWRWSLGSRNYENRQNPTYSFKDTGVQNITLWVINQFGCRDSITKNLLVNSDVTFYLPTAFTPNFDSQNDEFKGVGFVFGMKDFRLSVWNRWGEKMFETTDYLEGWNGAKNNIGRPVPEGIYLYELTYTTPRNGKVTKRDMVTLMR